MGIHGVGLVVTGRIWKTIVCLTGAWLAMSCNERSVREDTQPASSSSDGGNKAETSARRSPVEQPEPDNVEMYAPPPDAGDIATEVSSFRGFEHCTTALGGKIPPAVSELMSDIGYYKATDDTCRTLQSLADRTVDVCDELQLRAARQGCKRRYAMYHGEPDLCPNTAAHGGREPLCVAVAMRDPSMCYAELDTQRVGVCRAIILRNERPCRVAYQNATAASRCGRAAKRWWSVVPPTRPRPALPVGFTPSLSLCPTSSTGDAGANANTDDGGRGESCEELAYLVKRGIVLRPQEAVVVGGRSRPPIGPRRSVLELRFPRPRLEGEGSSSLPLRFDLTMVNVSAWIDVDADLLTEEGSSCDMGHIEIDRFAPRRGSVVSGTFELAGGGPGNGDCRFRGSFLTFVRDVIAQRSEGDDE